MQRYVSSFPAAEMNQRKKLVGTFLYDHSEHDTTNEDLRATVLSGPGWNPIRLIVGTVVRTKTDGDVEFGAMMLLGRTETLGGVLEHPTFGPTRAPSNSVSLEAGLTGLVQDLRSQFPLSLNRFVAALETESD